MPSSAFRDNPLQHVVCSYGARTLVEGLGLDYSLIDGPIAQVHLLGMLDFIHTLSMACLGLTLHPRIEMILSPPPRIRSLPVKPIHSLSYNPSIEVVAAMQLHRSVIAPTLTFTPASLPIIHATTLASMLPYRPGDDIDVVLHHLASVGGPYLCSDELVPNRGIGVKPYPVSIAPPAAIEAH